MAGWQQSIVRTLLAIAVGLLLATGLVAVRLRANPDADVIVGRPPTAVQQPLVAPVTTVLSVGATVGGAIVSMY